MDMRELSLLIANEFTQLESEGEALTLNFLTGGERQDNNDNDRVDLAV
ncbi:hypothetical protein [Lysinibacillus sp. NPDC086135]